MAKKVLVVDDDLPILRLLEITLSRAGYEVVKATDGLQGLQMLQEESPDVVLLDIVMPRMDGYEMLRRMRADSSFSDLPVIVLTALDTDAHEGRITDVTAHVTKPVAVDQLLDLVAQVGRTVDAQPGGPSLRASAM